MNTLNFPASRSAFWRWRIILGLLGWLGAIVVAHAQASVSPKLDVAITTIPGYGSSSLTLGSLLTVNGNTAGGTGSCDLPMRIDESQVLFFNVSNVQSVRVTLAEAGYSFLIDGVARTTYEVTSLTTATTQLPVTVTLVRQGENQVQADNTRPVGEAGSIAWGAPYSFPGNTNRWTRGNDQWPYISFHLGAASNGVALPPLRVPLLARDDNSRMWGFSEVVPPAGAGVAVTRPANDQYNNFTLYAPQVTVVHTVDPVSGNFTIAFSAPGSADSFASYSITFSTNEIKITKTVSGGNTYETRFTGAYGYTGITLTNDLGGGVRQSNPWTIEDWHQQGTSAPRIQRGQRTSQTLYGATPGQPGDYYIAAKYTDVIESKDASGTVQAKNQHEYVEFMINGDTTEGASQVVLVKSTEGVGDGDYVTSTYRHPLSPGVVSTEFPTGATRVESGGPSTGRKEICEPWLDEVPYDNFTTDLGGGRLPVYDHSLGTKTTFDYPYSQATDFSWPASIVRQRGAQTLSKTTFVYDLSGSVNNQKLAIVTRTDYKDATTADLVTSTKQYRPDTDDAALRGRPHSLALPDGTKQSFAYEHGSYSASTQTFTAGGGDALRVSIFAGTAATAEGATLFQAMGTLTVDDVYLHNNRSTKTVEIYQNARLVRRETHVYSGGDFTRISWENYVYTADGRLTSRTASSGSSYSATWVGTRKSQESDETGLVTSFNVLTDYDAADRLIGSSRAAVSTFSLPALRTAYEYSASNQVTATRVGPSGAQLSTTVAYNLGGRVTSRTVPNNPSGITTKYTYTNGGRTITETYGYGTTEQSDKTIAYFKDGRVKSITGSAVVAEYHTYDLDASNRPRHTVRLTNATTGRSRVTVTDLLGRTLTEETQGFPESGGGRKSIVTTSGYNGKGQLESVIVRYDPTIANLALSADKLMTYDAFGVLSASGLNLDGSAGLQDGGTDRFAKYENRFYSDASGWWRLSSTTVPYDDNSLNTYTTAVYTRLSGFGTGVVSQVDTYDFYNNRTSASVSCDSSTNSRSETTLLPDGTYRRKTTVGGLLVSEQIFADDAAIGTATAKQTITYAYDAQGRRKSQTDARGLVTRYEYYTGTTQLYQTFGRNKENNADVLLTTMTYDGVGRIASTTDAKNRTTSLTYWPNGKIKESTGTGTHPLHYEYNAYGEQKELWTYRDGATPDKTLWSYDEQTGWLTSKTDAASKVVVYSYGYASPYKTVTRSWARGVTTTSKYLLATGDLARVDYSDGTPSIAYGYTRTGKIKTVTDATGTRDYVYDREQLSGEGLSAWFNSLVVTELYDNTTALDRTNNLVPGRYAGFKLGTTSNLELEMKESFGRDDFGRISGVTVTYAQHGSRGPLTVAGIYDYEPNTAFWRTLTQGSYSLQRKLETGRDVIESETSRWGSAALTQYAYVINAAGERTSVVQQGSAFDSGYGAATCFNYDYNSAGELTDAKGFLASSPSDIGSPLPGRGFHFDYDTAGNRQKATVDNESVDYTDGQGGLGANALNQVKARGTLKTRVSGTADANAAVAVDGNLVPSRQGRYWDVPLPGFAQNRSIDITADLNAQSQRASVWALARPASETFSYDDDGNLTGDAQWTYTWDAENRLIQATAKTDWGLPGRTLWFTYDYLGRRVRKADSAGSDRKYVYHGWDLMAEIDPATNLIVRSYAWGLDIGGSLSAAGGVGALVLETVHTSTSLQAYHVAADANGNVTALVSTSSGASASFGAVYEYDPYGQLLRKTGPEAVNNPFRFSTKYTDTETGLVYYGHRYYSTSLGRFINRDPIGEAGGANLYAFVGNSPANRWDYLGQSWLSSAWKKIKAAFGRSSGEEDSSPDESETMDEPEDSSSTAEKDVQNQQESRGAPNNEMVQMAPFVVGERKWTRQDELWYQERQFDRLLQEAYENRMARLVAAGWPVAESQGDAIRRGFAEYAGALNFGADMGEAIGWFAVPGGSAIELGEGAVGLFQLGRSGLRAVSRFIGKQLGKATENVGPKAYSVAFRTRLAPESYPGASRAAHFQEANGNLLKAMEEDASFAKAMKNLGVNLERTPTGLAPRQSPANWTWHHAESLGEMQLVPRIQHTPGSAWWDILHPGGQGGYFIWGK